MTLNVMAMNFDVFLLRHFKKQFPDLMDYSLYTPKFFYHLGNKAYINASTVSGDLSRGYAICFLIFGTAERNWVLQNLFGMGVRQLKEQVLTTIGTDISDHEVFKLGIVHESFAPKRSRVKMARLMFSVSAHPGFQSDGAIGFGS